RIKSLWAEMPFSRHGRYRRASARFIAADAAFRLRLRAELARLRLDARRSELTELEEILDPVPWNRPVWIREGIIGYGTSGNIAKTIAESPDDPEVEEKVRRFRALAESARKWPEFIQRQLQASEVERFQRPGGWG
ncbi:MAG: hypothetical protein ABI401_14035, partial [Candidatus Dormibacter sp.]